MENTTPIDQRRSISFRPRARLIRLLGDELISDEVMAVVELVKNGYDADASHVSVTLENVAGPSGGIISVMDNGSGMNLDDLLHRWMEPATAHKRGRNGSKVRTPSGRIQLGEKGVGRFAADKLGAELELITKRAEAGEELVLIVNWDHFDQDAYLEDVRSHWFARQPAEFIGDAHGTVLNIRSLRAVWNTEMVARLNNGLARLVSPFSRSTDFCVELRCTAFPSLSGRVINRILETAAYRLTGEIDHAGVLKRQDGDERCIDLRPLSHDRFLSAGNALRQPSCGPFTLSLHVWDLELQAGKGFGVDRTLRDAIKSSSGVSIYRDGFRIWPYGEKDDDWLELNQRRVNNPTLRVSNNQVIGFVEITHAGNPDLRDRTSREGLIDSPALFDLKALVLAALSVLEAERFQLRRKTVSARTNAVDVEQDELLDFLAEMHIDGEAQSNGWHAASREIKQLYRKRLAQEQERYERLSRLAGAGMAAEMLTDALTREVSQTVMLLRTLQGEVQTGTTARLQHLVDVLSTHMEAVNVQLDMMEPLYRPWLQDNEPVHIQGAIYDVLSLLKQTLTATGSKVAVTGSRNLTVRLNRGHLMQALMILIDNALVAMKEGSTVDPYIELQIVEEKEYQGLLIADNGPGIPYPFEALVFEPYFSFRKAGRGLGLHIARDILAMFNSSISQAPGRSRLSGACFEIRFDRRRVVAIHGDRDDQ